MVLDRYDALRSDTKYGKQEFEIKFVCQLCM